VYIDTYVHTYATKTWGTYQQIRKNKTELGWVEQARKSDCSQG